MSTRFKFVVCILIFGGSLSSLAVDTKKGATLTDQLDRYYAPSITASLAKNQAQPRSLFIQKPGLMAVAAGDVALLEVCPSIYRDGELHPTPGYFCSELERKQHRTLSIYERVYVERLQANRIADRVEVHLSTCARCESPTDPSNLRALVVFQFPKGYLAQSTAEEVIRAMDTLLTAESAGAPAATNEQKPDPCKAVPPAAAPSGRANANSAGKDPAASTVKKDQSPAEVEKMLGKPQSIVDLGTKLIYVYPMFRLLFLNGKLADIQ
jgi:hypothetical protein